MNFLFQWLPIWDRDSAQQARWKSTANAKVRFQKVKVFFYQTLFTVV